MAAASTLLHTGSEAKVKARPAFALPFYSIIFCA
jgi:hypothetical protein